MACSRLLPRAWNAGTSLSINTVNVIYSGVISSRSPSVCSKFDRKTHVILHHTVKLLSRNPDEMVSFLEFFFAFFPLLYTFSVYCTLRRYLISFRRTNPCLFPPFFFLRFRHKL